MTKPRQLKISTIRRTIPLHWNCKVGGNGWEQEYLFYSAHNLDYSYVLTASKSRDTVTVCREDLKIDEETGEVYKSYLTLFTTSFMHLSNGLRFIKKCLR